MKRISLIYVFYFTADMTSQRESTSANRDRKIGVAADNASNTGVTGVN